MPRSYVQISATAWGRRLRDDAHLLLDAGRPYWRTSTHLIQLADLIDAPHKDSHMSKLAEDLGFILDNLTGADAEIVRLNEVVSAQAAELESGTRLDPDDVAAIQRLAEAVAARQPGPGLVDDAPVS